MLVLSRNTADAEQPLGPEQTLVLQRFAADGTIVETITIALVEAWRHPWMRHGKARLGIDAGANWTIKRGECADQPWRRQPIRPAPGSAFAGAILPRRASLDAH